MENITQEQIEQAEAAMKPVLEAALREINKRTGGTLNLNEVRFLCEQQFDGSVSFQWSTYPNGMTEDGTTKTSPTVHEAIASVPDQSIMRQLEIAMAKRKLALAKAELARLEAQ